jgi:hypothetical protein
MMLAFAIMTWMAQQQETMHDTLHGTVLLPSKIPTRHHRLCQRTVEAKDSQAQATADTPPADEVRLDAIPCRDISRLRDTLRQGQLTLCPPPPS